MYSIKFEHVYFTDKHKLLHKRTWDFPWDFAQALPDHPMTKHKTIFAPSLEDEAGTIMIGGTYHIITRGHRHILPSFLRTVLLGKPRELSWQINVRTISTEDAWNLAKSRAAYHLLSGSQPVIPS